jgi:hypothetical protein
VPVTYVSDDPGDQPAEAPPLPPVTQPTDEPNPLLSRITAIETALAALGDAVGAGGNSAMKPFAEWRKTIT